MEMKFIQLIKLDMLQVSPEVEAQVKELLIPINQRLEQLKERDQANDLQIHNLFAQMEELKKIIQDLKPLPQEPESVEVKRPQTAKQPTAPPKVPQKQDPRPTTGSKLSQSTIVEKSQQPEVQAPKSPKESNVKQKPADKPKPQVQQPKPGKQQQVEKVEKVDKNKDKNNKHDQPEKVENKGEKPDKVDKPAKQPKQPVKKEEKEPKDHPKDHVKDVKTVVKNPKAPAKDGKKAPENKGAKKGSQHDDAQFQKQLDEKQTEEKVEQNVEQVEQKVEQPEQNDQFEKPVEQLKQDETPTALPSDLPPQGQDYNHQKVQDEQFGKKYDDAQVAEPEQQPDHQSNGHQENGHAQGQEQVHLNNQEQAVQN
ncbi:hypothetical protein pb186bvf_005567 [Paramecium bursaria]